MQANMTFIGAKRRVRRKRRTEQSAAPAGLTLVSVAYQEGAWVRLTFDRAVDTTGGAEWWRKVVVSDASTGETMRGVGPVTRPTPASVHVGLDGDGPSTGPGVRLTVEPGSGIVASDGGEAFGGVSGVAIPFG